MLKFIAYSGCFFISLTHKHTHTESEHKFHRSFTCTYTHTEYTQIRFPNNPINRLISSPNPSFVSVLLSA